MKSYNFEYMKKIIENEKSNGLTLVDAGMREDWSWTSEEVWTKENLYNVDIFSDKEIGGIDGSAWATPIMVLYYENGKEIIVECFDDDGTKVEKEEEQRMKEFARITGGMDYKN